MRRVWIEMILRPVIIAVLGSPSMRRVWIEIPPTALQWLPSGRHPPRGGCGLKYFSFEREVMTNAVTLHAEGVD